MKITVFLENNNQVNTRFNTEKQWFHATKKCYLINVSLYYVHILCVLFYIYYSLSFRLDFCTCFFFLNVYLCFFCVFLRLIYDSHCKYLGIHNLLSGCPPAVIGT